MEKYPKLTTQNNCKYPERDNCNYDENGLKRCEFMKYDNSQSIFSSSRWYCQYAKLKNEIKDNKEVIKELLKEK